MAQSVGGTLIGRRLGAFEITALLGRGGMGEVYRAADHQLGRAVAIKVLPEAFTLDPDRLARFEREARVLASLNHPNIAAIYGLEQGLGTRALVLELVEGHTLAERIADGPLAISHAIAIARQIADALAAAHDRGIVHRDLKPANVKVTPEGLVKVLDFGLAKAQPTADSNQDEANSPTLTVDRTISGIVLGTAAYMSPEQARGASVDKRADIWAFGCVLFEMLARRRAFDGVTVTDTIAAILEREPDWSALPRDTPAPVRWLLERSLRKDARRRLHDIGDALIELEDVGAQKPAGAGSPESHHATRRERLAWGAAAVLALVAVFAALQPARAPALRPPELVEFPVAPPEGSSFTGTSPEFAISPDGRHVVFAASSKTGWQLWIRSLASQDVRPIPGTEGARNPFWRPDSQAIGFFASHQVKTLPLSGGVPVVVCDGPATMTGIPPAGTWSTGNVIVFGPFNGELNKVSAGGGTPTAVTKVAPADPSFRWPSFLPDARHFLFTALRDNGSIELRVGSIVPADGTATIGEFESNAIFGDGHLFFVRGGYLIAQPFDPDAQRLTGDARPLGVQARLDSVVQRGMFSVASTGRVVYRPTSQTPSQLTWFDRGGHALATIGDPAAMLNLDLSPDGQHVAVSEMMQAGVRLEVDIWIIDLASGRTRRLTDDPGWKFDPAWSPDGAEVAFDKRRGVAGQPSRFGLFVRPANGSGENRAVVEGEFDATLATWSSSGRIVYTRTGGDTGPDLWTRVMATGRDERFLGTKYTETAGVFSPDGKWIAYQSDASGRTEVYVRPFPARDPAYPVSRDGGVTPRWRADGRELYFIAPDGVLMAARIDATAAFSAGLPEPLFRVAVLPGNNRTYAVAKDGQRFLVPVELSPPLHVVLDWRALPTR
jgi:serine/threonine protein kinase